MFLKSGDRIWAEHVKEEDELMKADKREYEIARRHQQKWKTSDELLTETNEMRQCWEMMKSSDKGRRLIISNFIEKIVVFDEETNDPGKIKITLTIKTDPLGEYTKQITANIPILPKAAFFSFSLKNCLK